MKFVEKHWVILLVAAVAAWYLYTNYYADSSTTQTS